MARVEQRNTTLEASSSCPRLELWELEICPHDLDLCASLAGGSSAKVRGVTVQERCEVHTEPAASTTPASFGLREHIAHSQPRLEHAGWSATARADTDRAREARVWEEIP
jgi:hypothetical protein